MNVEEPLNVETPPAGRSLSPTQVAQGLKERVYATFTGLSILLVIHHDTEHSAGPASAAGALLVGVFGIIAAGFLSDIIAHLAAHRSLPGGRELRHMLWISVGGLLTITLPLILLSLSAAGWLGFLTALDWSLGTYIATLAVIGYLAVRRAHIRWWSRVLLLSALMILGGVVIALQLLAHG